MRTDIKKDQFKICLIGETSEPCFSDCRTCQLAHNYMKSLSIDKGHDNVPSLDKCLSKFNVWYKLNSTDTIAECKSLENAIVLLEVRKQIPFYEYSEVGYSSAIIKRYPLFARLKKTCGLPIPRRILWSSNKDPLIVVYDDCVYMIASVIPIKH